MAAVVVCGALVFASQLAEAGPRASDLLRDARTFLRVATHATGTATLTGPGAADVRTWAHAKAEPAPLAWSFARDKQLQLGGADGETLEHKNLGLRRTPSAVRVLAFALGTVDLKRGARRLGGKLPRELMTLDRIDGAYVWAVGDGDVAVWLDRELGRPVRFLLGRGVVDEHVWTVRLRYDDKGSAKGWVPDLVELQRDEAVWVTVTLAAK